MDIIKCISGVTKGGFYVLDPKKLIAELQQTHLEDYNGR